MRRPGQRREGLGRVGGAPAAELLTRPDRIGLGRAQRSDRWGFGPGPRPRPGADGYVAHRPREAQLQPLTSPWSHAWVRAESLPVPHRDAALAGRARLPWGLPKLRTSSCAPGKGHSPERKTLGRPVALSRSVCVSGGREEDRIQSGSLSGHHPLWRRASPVSRGEWPSDFCVRGHNPSQRSCSSVSHPQTHPLHLFEALTEIKVPHKVLRREC